MQLYIRFLLYIELLKNDSVPQIRLVLLVGKAEVVVEAARAVIMPTAENYEEIA